MRLPWRSGLAGVLLLSAACGDVPGTVQVGAPAPAYAATRLEGGPASLAELRGRPVLMNVWATWCHPCREEMPALEQIHRTYAPRGLQVLGVSIDQGGQERAIRAFLAEFGVTYAQWLDPEGEVQSIYSTIGVPNTFLIAADGTLLWKHVGPLTADDPTLRGHIEGALRAGS